MFSEKVFTLLSELVTAFITRITPNKDAAEEQAEGTAPGAQPKPGA